VSAHQAPQTRIRWLGEGAREVPLDHTNLIVRAAQEPFRGWARPLEGLELAVGSKIPIGRGLGSSAAAIAAGVLLGARLRALRLTGRPPAGQRDAGPAAPAGAPPGLSLPG